MELVYEWLQASLFWLGALLFVFGAVWFVYPAGVLRLAALLDRWISTAFIFSRLDEQIRVERLFYRHHRLVGILIVLGAGFCLYTLYPGGYQTLWADFQQPGKLDLADIVADSMLLVLALGNLFALVTGLIVIVRPSLLKRLEGWGNRWIESDSVTAMLDKRLDVAENWLPRHPRLLGLLILIGSLYIMSNTAMLALN